MGKCNKKKFTSTEQSNIVIMKYKKFDVVIIGGGFYGCMIALLLRNYYDNILIVEQKKEIMTQASYHNQARVHNGYHYPRNFLTGFRSHRNYGQFIHDFRPAVDDTNTMMYAIARSTSKITSCQFIKFCKQIESPLKPLPTKFKKLFNEQLIEDSFLVDEVVFNAAKIRKILKEKLQKAKVSVLTNATAKKVELYKNTIYLTLSDDTSLPAKNIINCSYSHINTLLFNSQLPLLPFKHEYAEMPLVEMPDPFKKIGITIMDGPFFSLMPFPDKKMHSFHHVRYTPHYTWFHDLEANELPKNEKSNFLYMQKDAIRYISALKDLQYKNSLYQVKTVLQQNESNDGRPILYRKDYGFKNFHIVMGGKIDNIYDVCREMQKEHNPHILKQKDYSMFGL